MLQHVSYFSLSYSSRFLLAGSFLADFGFLELEYGSVCDGSGNFSVGKDWLTKC